MIEIWIEKYQGATLFVNGNRVEMNKEDVDKIMDITKDYVDMQKESLDIGKV